MAVGLLDAVAAGLLQGRGRIVNGYGFQQQLTGQPLVELLVGRSGVLGGLEHGRVADDAAEDGRILVHVPAQAGEDLPLLLAAELGLGLQEQSLRRGPVVLPHGLHARFPVEEVLVPERGALQEAHLDLLSQVEAAPRFRELLEGPGQEGQQHAQSRRHAGRDKGQAGGDAHGPTFPSRPPRV